MATPFHTTVRLDGFRIEDTLLTYNIEGNVSRANDVGKAVSLTANQNSVKLAGDGDAIIGRIEVIENRADGNVATVAHRFSGKMPLKANANVSVGDSVVGGGDGTVKAANATDTTDNFVVAVDSTHATVNRM